MYELRRPKPKQGRGNNEVSSSTIRSFDEEAFHDLDDDAYDAVFGRGNKVSTEDDDSRLNMLEEALINERRSKNFLFSIFMIVLITFSSIIMNQKKLLRLERKNMDYFNDDRPSRQADDFLSENSSGGEQFEHDNYGGYQNDKNSDLFDHGELYYDEDETENQDYDKSTTDYESSTGGTASRDDTYESKPDSDQENFGYENANDAIASEQEEGSAIEFDYDEHSSSLDNFAEDMLSSKFANVEDPFRSNPGNEVPFLFFIPRTAAALQEQLLLKCHGLVAASARNLFDDDQNKLPFLQIITTSSNEKFVNVDLKTPEGIDRAIKLELIDSNLAQIVIASRISEASNIFNSPYSNGRCFTLLRRPIDRAVSLFNALRESPWEHSFKEEFRNMTLEEYALSDHSESNWITRILTNKLTGPISVADLAKAKQFLKTKCLIGLTDKFDVSYERIKKYFDWGENSESETSCETEIFIKHLQDNERQSHTPTEGSTVYEALYKRNELDMELYEHALEVFNFQNNFFYESNHTHHDYHLYHL